jgi:hypothetical protein
MTKIRRSIGPSCMRTPACIFWPDHRGKCQTMEQLEAEIKRDHDEWYEKYDD